MSAGLRGAPVLVAAAAVLVFASCSGDAGRPRSEAPKSTTTASSPSPSVPTRSSEPERTAALDEGLLYLDGRTLRHVALAGNSEEVVGKLPSVDVTAARDGDKVAYVVPSAPSPQDEDFIALPELRVRDITSGSESTIGPGTTPLWHPGGTRLAYLEPVGARVCEGEVCEGSAAVVIADVGNEQRVTVLRAGRWVLLAWLGDELVVADQETASTLVVDLAGRTRRLDVAPNEFWGASPDGRWIAAVRGGALRFLRPSGVLRAGPSFDLSGRLLAEGSWSSSSDVIASVVLNGRGGSGGSSLALIDPMSGIHVVEGSSGAAGPVLWGVNGSSFVYVRSSGSRALRLEAVHCELDDPTGCTRVLSWARGVTLLAVTSRG